MPAQEAVQSQSEHLSANWLHALNLLKPLPLFFFSEEGQQAAEALLTLAVVQLI